MKKLVMVNVSFKDAYTGKKYVAGEVIELSEERIAEVKEIDKNLISVVGNVAESDETEEKEDKEKKDEENKEIPAKSKKAAK